MIYYAHIVQVASGCDHSIGCGHITLRLDTTSTIEAAKNELRELLTDEYPIIDTAATLSSVSILSVDREVIIALNEVDEWMGDTT